MRSPVSPLNKALYDRLKIAVAPVPVYDYVPDGKTPPYTVMTETVAEPWLTKTIAGAEATATIKIISTYQGDKEVAELADKAITNVLRSSLLLAEAWQVAITNVVSHTVERLETHREATIQFKFTIIDMKE